MAFASLNAAATVAVPPALVTYDIKGVCGDCTGFGVAHLTLKDYTLGTAITAANFDLFKYDGTPSDRGTAFYAPYTINGSESNFDIAGSLATDLGPSSLGIYWGGPDGGVDGVFFFTTTAGVWKTGTYPYLISVGPGKSKPFVPGADTGNSYTITTAGDPAASGSVPEPGSMAIIGLGLVGLIALRRRQLRAQ